MATIVNNPPQSNDSGGSMVMIIGLIVFAVIAFIFFVYGIPAIQQMQSGSPQVNIPSKIDINVKQSE